LNNFLVFLLTGNVLLICFHINPTEANVGLTSNQIVGEVIDSVGFRFNGKREITTETTVRGPIQWVSFEKEVNGNFVVANKVLLGRKMKGKIGSESDRDCFYTEVPSVMKVSFKLETSLPIPIPSSNIGVGVTVYAEDQETILGAFISDTSNPGEVNMVLNPGIYYLLINRLPSSHFVKDLTYNLTVKPSNSRRLHVVAKVGRRESASPLRTMVDRSVDFTVYAFTRDDSSDMAIVENFQWSVPSKLVGKFGKSVGSLSLTTVAGVDEEIIFRVGSTQSAFRVITTPGKVVEVVIDPPVLLIEPGETERFSARAQDEFGNNVVRNFGWHVVGDIGTIDGRRGDFRAGHEPGEGWIIAVANTQLIFSDVEATLEGTGKVVVGGGTPQLYSLEQNTPNPFNPSTTISFQLPISSHVRLTVFNSLGQRVEQLIDAPISSGSHQVEWQSNDRRTGVYFYELRTDPIGETHFFNLKVEPFVARKKMLLVR
jgi:hypothetical protein